MSDWQWAENTERQRFEEERMTAIAKDTGRSEFKRLPAGTHQAVCNMVVNLGAHPTSYLGADTGLKEQAYLRWEVPSERIEYEQNGQQVEGPMTIGRTYTLSLNEKARLCQDLEAWRGKPFSEKDRKGFDVVKVLGACCQVIVTHRESEGKTYANLTGIAGWPKGLPPIEAENELLSYGPGDTANFDKLPNWMQEKINSAATQESENPPLGDVPFDDDIPF
jgi:hypothetical protein